MLAVQSARDLGPQFVDNPHRMVGQDGAFSFPVGAAAFFYFGDTLVGRRTPGESLWYPGGVQLGPGDMGGYHGIDYMRTTTGLLLRDYDASAGLHGFEYITAPDGRLKQLIPRENGEHPDQIRPWCLHGVELGEHVYLYYIVVRMLAQGPMPVNFETVGCGCAVGRAGAWDFKRLPDTQGRTLWWDASQPQFGSAVLPVASEGMLYVYGVMKDPHGVQTCYLARVSNEEIQSPAAYRYWTGREEAWSPRVQDAAPLMTGMPNEMSVSFNAYLGCYLAVHSLDITGKIVGRTALNPWGPWSEPVTLWTATHPELGYPVPYGALIYAGKEHPTLARGGGKVLYLTYVEFEEYFPHLIEVTLA